MIGKDKLKFDLDFPQSLDQELGEDSVLIGGAQYNLEDAPKKIIRQDLSARMILSGPLAEGSDAQLANATVDSAPTGAVRTSNIATITTTAVHGYSVGDEITISGVTDSSFDGSFVIESVPTTTTFTYTNSGGDTTSGVGSIVNHTHNPWPMMLGAIDSAGLVGALQRTGTSLDVNITGGAAGSNAEYAEDSPHSSGETGNFILAVANHVEGALHSADGDYAVLQVDGSGRLRVIADLDVTNLAEKAEDSAHGSGDIGNYILSVRQDIPVGSTSADGDYQSLKTDNIGNLWVKHNGDITIADGGNSITVDNGGTFAVQEDGAALTALQLIDNIVLLEDIAAVGGEAGVQALAVRQDTLANSVTADGDFASLKLNSVGALWTAPVGNVADNAVDVGNPIKIGARAVEPLPANVANNDRVDLLTDLRRRLYVVDMPNIGSIVGAVTVGTAEVAVPASNLTERTRMFIQNQGNKSIYIGPTGVTTASGLCVSPGGTLTLEVGDQISLFAISSNAGQDVRVFEMA